MQQIIRFKRILTVILALAMFLSLLHCFTVSSFAAPPLPAYNDQPRDVVCTTLSSDAKAYYTGAYTFENLMTLSGASDVSTSARAAQNNKLYDALQKLMTDTHTYQTSYSGTSSGSLAYYWNRTDATQGSNVFMLFYLGTPTPGYSGDDFNREHVWPKSNASFNQAGGGSDLHHLRPADPKVNSAHSNLPFGNVNGIYQNVTVGNCYWKTSTLFEPRDNVKGDIARILLYVYVRWGENNIYSDTSNGGKIIENLRTLLEWMEIDPVDTWEMKRNDLIEDVQGNRNVFIDYPELAYKLFGRTAPDGMATPSMSLISTCSHSYKLAETVPATCLDSGEKRYICTKCGQELVETLDPLGHVDVDDDGECDRCGMYIGVSVTMYKKTEITDGMHIAFYMPSQQVLLSEDDTNNKIAPLSVSGAGEKLVLPDGAMIFTAREQESGIFRFVTDDGKYLTSLPTGNGVFYADTPDDYSLWTLETASEGVFHVVNVNAKYNNTTVQALEYYRGNITTYGVKNDSNYEFNVYATRSHIWDKGYVEPVEGTAVHRLIQQCVCCGETRQTILDRRQGDFNLDGELSIIDVACLLNMLATDCEWTQDDDVDGDGAFNILDVTLLLTVLSQLKG